MEVFKEIGIGGVTAEELVRRLGGAGIQFNKYAEVLFKHPSFSPTRQIESVKLVKVSLSDLGLESPCSYQDVTGRAAALGLRLCPLYLGAFLRLEYRDQPEGSYLTIASPAAEGDGDHPIGFYVRNFDEALWLRGYRALGDADWPPDNAFIFLR